MDNTIFTTITTISSKITDCTLAKPVPDSKFNKIKIKKNATGFYTEKFTSTQAFQSNLNEEELVNFLLENIGINFKHVFLQTDNQEFTFLTNKKNKTSILKKNKKNNSYINTSNQNFTTTNTAPEKILNNRKKKYILEEGIPINFLIHLGIMNPQGIVFSQKYDKFRQINRFLEYIKDILPNICSNQNSNLQNPIRIIDFGCGKSYLTFAVYHYFTNILHIPVKITGLDLKDDVITMCSLLAKEFGFDNLTFYSGTIEQYFEKQPDEQCDLVITLHACDTATDYALASAIKQKTKVILSVPCCQHELNLEYKGNNNQPGVKELLKYGIIKERFFALATDVMRCELLEENGYDVQLLEFIDISHTPKNLMIRAVCSDSKRKQEIVQTNGYKNLANLVEQDITLAKLLNLSTFK